MGRTFLIFTILIYSFVTDLAAQEQQADDEYYSQRKILVDSLFNTENQKIYGELKEALMKVRREEYISENYKSIAYKNMPVPSTGGLIQPSPEMVSIILKESFISENDKVLLIGRNTAYINSVISLLTDKLFVIDPQTSFPPDVAYPFKSDMSFYGWLEEAPFDVIIIFGSLEEIPRNLISQIKVNGKIIFPLSFKSGNQVLTKINRYSNSFDITSIGESYIHPLR